jgi:hypothetical protein
MVICELNLDTQEKIINKNILWNLNESVLDNEKINEGMINLCKEIPDLKINCKNKWYDCFIKKICNFLKKVSRIINGIKKEEKNNLFQELKRLVLMS